MCHRIRVWRGESKGEADQRGDSRHRLPLRQKYLLLQVFRLLDLRLIRPYCSGWPIMYRYVSACITLSHNPSATTRKSSWRVFQSFSTSSQVYGIRIRKRGRLDDQGRCTLNKAPIVERIIIAATETTTLSNAHRQQNTLKGFPALRRVSYQLQAFSADTTGFIVQDGSP